MLYSTTSSDKAGEYQGKNVPPREVAWESPGRYSDLMGSMILVRQYTPPCGNRRQLLPSPARLLSMKGLTARMALTVCYRSIGRPIVSLFFATPSIGVCLHAVAAHRHHAPTSRTIFRRVIVDPPTFLVATGFEPCPGSLVHGGEYNGEQSAHGPI